MGCACETSLFGHAQSHSYTYSGKQIKFYTGLDLVSIGMGGSLGVASG